MYCTLCAETFAALVEKLKGTAVRPLITVCVNLRELTTVDEALRIASIATSRNPSQAYLVVDVEWNLDGKSRRGKPDRVNALVASLEESRMQNSRLAQSVSSDVIDK
jgi:hypothetical protein